ncbi:hypothetical protein BJY04DRAFT_229337 [Aspergillus karnatakaensis]|uniref:uncharacterized protein n=1 Tax=Aspergillus karnatakaensis TaxID=1810916 RepID=UPI003CCCA7CC
MDDEVLVYAEAKLRSAALFKEWIALNELLQRHEATIQKRWVKKTRQQRLSILLDAWPSMPAKHRPDFNAFRKNKKGPHFENLYKWPYINQEDLVKTKTLLLLLKSRGRHLLSEFAAADNEAMRLGKVTQGLIPIFLNEHVMILNGFTTHSSEYGKLLEWNDHPEAFELMMSRKQFLPGEVLLILEAQQRIHEFLLRCCELILHDVPEEAVLRDYPVVPEPALKSETEINGFESLAVMAAEAPYRAPGKLDLGRIASLLSARASAAEGHIWALREDPDYYLRQFLEYKEHRQEMLKDSNGTEHHILTGNRKEVFWARVIGGIVWDPYSDLEIFSELSKQATHLEVLQKKYAAEIPPDKELPSEYLEAFIRFRYYVDQAAKAPLLKLKRSGQAAPPIRRFFERIPPPDTVTTMIGVQTKESTKMSDIEHEFLWLLNTLGQDGKPLFFATLPLIAENLLTAYLTEVIGDLSIISQCLHQINIYQPWAQRWDSYLWERDREKTLEKEYKAWSDPWGRIRPAIGEKNMGRIAKLGEPSGGRFAYPFEKRPTRELWRLCAAPRRISTTYAGGLRGSAINNLLSLQRILQRTKEWVEPEQQKAPPKSKPEPSTDADAYSFLSPISRMYAGSSALKVDIPQPKRKVKTRGTPRPSQPEVQPEPLAPSNLVDRQPTFPVNARALKVFRTLFFNPNVTSTPGEIPWTDFLHAMATVGFEAMKLYGSVWQFQPTNLDVERSIQFHEPHPKGKMPFTVARRFGRMFVLEK